MFYHVLYTIVVRDTLIARECTDQQRLIELVRFMHDTDVSRDRSEAWLLLCKPLDIPLEERVKARGRIVSTELGVFRAR